MILSLQQLQRPLRFGLVGLSGVVVNTTLLWTLARGAQLPVPLASVLATEAAILSNFLLNDRWTFRAVARRHPPLIRLARFNGVSLGGMAITVALLTLLSSYAGLHLLLANMLAIGGAMSWNYFVNSRWTWRGTTTDDRRPTTDEVLVETGLRRQETGDSKSGLCANLQSPISNFQNEIHAFISAYTQTSRASTHSSRASCCAAVSPSASASSNRSSG
jgi:putative flippase GtrA